MMQKLLSPKISTLIVLPFRRDTTLLASLPIKTVSAKPLTGAELAQVRKLQKLLGKG
jgi:hypothetical protein